MERQWRVAVACLPLGILCLTGCLIPYAYPNLDLIPGTDIASTDPDVHYFRIDVAAHEVDLGVESRFTIDELPRRSDGGSTAQIGLSADYGFYVLGIAVNFNVGWLHTTRLRIYRPGFPLIELAPWELDLLDGAQSQSRQKLVAANTPINWHGQEKVIDELIRCPAVSESETMRRQNAKYKGAHPLGTPSEQDIRSSPKAFAFAASEYERLARSAPTPEDAVRVCNKARELRAPLLPQQSSVLPSGQSPPNSPETR
jgi:hypothetical protein